MSSPDPNGPVSLRWHQFSTNLGTTSSLLRESNILTDITFIVEEKQVPAHRFILASSSPLFLSLLHPSTHTHPMVYLRGVSYRDLTSLLDFMYQGEVKVEQRYLESFLNTAEELKVKGLSEGAGHVSGDGVEQDGDAANMDDDNNVNVVEGSLRDDKCCPVIECLKEIEELKHEAPFTFDTNPTEDPNSELNIPASTPSHQSTCQSASRRTPRTSKTKQASGKSVRKSLTEAKTTEKLSMKKEMENVKSPIEELPSLSAKRTSIYGKKQTEEWKTLSKKKSPQLSKKLSFEDALNQTIAANSSEKVNKKRKHSSEDALATRDKQQRRVKHQQQQVEVEIPDVSDKQKAISASLESAIKATKEEIRMLEGKAEEDDLPTLADATDGTIAEVEKVLRLSQEVLGDFEYVDNPDDNEDISLDLDEEVSDSSKENISQINECASVPICSPSLTSHKSNSITSEKCETSSENILTPVKYQPTAKNMSIISLMLVKANSSSSPWKCSICKKLFKYKSSAEEHIGLEHVEGKLQ